MEREGARGADKTSTEREGARGTDETSIEREGAWTGLRLCAGRSDAKRRFVKDPSVRRRCGGEGIHSVRESAREAGGDFDCIETDGARRGRSMEIRAGRQRGDEEIHELATKALTNDWGSGQPIMRAFSEHKAGGESTAEMR